MTTKDKQSKSAGSGDASADSDIDSLPIEKCFEELEHIVASLENDSIPLDKSIQLFERGMKLSRRCSTELTHIEKKIQIVIESTKGQPELRNFETPEN